MREHRLKLAGVLMLCGWLSGVQATPIRWTLSNILFDNGGTAAGSFFFDADTDTYSAVAITTFTATAQVQATFNTLLIGSSANGAFLTGAGDQSGQAFLQLVYFQFPLTNEGGTLYLIDPFFPSASSFDGTCIDASCASVTYGRLMVDGGVTAVPLPLPVWFLGSALAALGAVRRQIPSRVRVTEKRERLVGRLRIRATLLNLNVRLRVATIPH